jgi:hypothetical protein
MVLYDTIHSLIRNNTSSPTIHSLVQYRRHTPALPPHLHHTLMSLCRTQFHCLQSNRLYSYCITVLLCYCTILYPLSLQNNIPLYSCIELIELWNYLTLRFVNDTHWSALSGAGLGLGIVLSVVFFKSKSQSGHAWSFIEWSMQGV